MKYLYYPGCALKETGKVYDESLQAVFRKIDFPFLELPDWNCCGATSYMAVNELKAFALAARNLALAEEAMKDADQIDVIAPCNACFMVLNKTQKYMSEYNEIGEKVHHALASVGLEYEGRVRVRHPIDVIVNDFGLDRLSSYVTRPLTGLKIACYYGCQMVRPYAEFDDQENPCTMDQIMISLGAETVPWGMKTRCCGGSLIGTVKEVGLRLNYILLNEAQRFKADAVATACSLCQFNMECYQDEISRSYDRISLPIAYFSQVIGMALGIGDRELGLHRLFVPFNPKLTERGTYAGI